MLNRSFYNGYNGKINIKLRLLGILLLMLWCMSPILANSNEPNYSKDIQRIKNRGKLVVAMLSTPQPPFFYNDINGNLKGLDVTLANHMANRLDVDLEYNRDAKSFNDLVTLVANRKADVVISKLSRTLSRTQLVLFSNPYIVFRQALMINRLKLAEITSNPTEVRRFIKSFDGDLGVIANSSYMLYAQRNFPNAKVRKYPKWKDVVNAVFTGKVIAAYRDELEVKKVVRSRPDAPLKIKTVLLSDTRDAIAIAVNNEDTHFVYWINMLLDSLDLKYTTKSLLDEYSDIFITR